MPKREISNQIFQTEYRPNTNALERFDLREQRKCVTDQLLYALERSRCPLITEDQRLKWSAEYRQMALVAQKFDAHVSSGEVELIEGLVQRLEKARAELHGAKPTRISVPEGAGTSGKVH